MSPDTFRQLRRAGRLARAFRWREDGAAIVEFALIMPLLLLLYFGSIEASSLFTVDRRVTIIAGTVGDLVAQWDPNIGPLPTGTIDDYFAAAETIMTPYDPTGLEQVVSFVYVNGSGQTRVLWSRATPGATTRTTNSAFPLPPTSQMSLLARADGFFIAAEVSFSYRPVLGLVFSDAIELSHTSYFLPRFAECIRVGSSACS